MVPTRSQACSVSVQHCLSATLEPLFPRHLAFHPLSYASPVWPWPLALRCPAQLHDVVRGCPGDLTGNVQRTTAREPRREETPWRCPPGSSYWLEKGDNISPRSLASTRHRLEMQVSCWALCLCCCWLWYCCCWFYDFVRGLWMMNGYLMGLERPRR